MAHYRSSVCLFTCIACLGVAFSPSADGGQQVLNASARAVSQEIAQANSPPDDRQDSKPPKPSPAPDKNKSQPSKTSKSNSKIPKSVSNSIVTLSRQRGFLMLGLAAVVVTAAAVFIMLKLVSSDESNYPKRRRGRFERQNPKNSQFTNPDSPTNSHQSRPQETSSGGQSLSALPYPFDLPKGRSIESSDRPFIKESGQPEADGAAVEGDRINSDTSPLETHSNGYSNTGFNIPETTNQTDSLAKNKGIALPETDRIPQVDIIEALIEDLQQLNPAKRGKAIWELGQRGDSRAVEPLLDLLPNSDSKQYSLILASLSEIGIRTLKPMNNAWSISLQNENPEVRKNAIRDLTRIYELVNQISYLLQRATDDPDPEVQETARWAINQLNRLRPRSGID
ncbi:MULTISPECIES: HEAT repeat domain-containing protein [unclassified Microcoleus]|uniref:HEAT repeat domain-containing protein n=1 Tax=unclassified Microcoleus TaxID=2642155 RepID=UPI002FD5520B